jgi:hypothetical protein
MNRWTEIKNEMPVEQNNRVFQVSQHISFHGTMANMTT